MTVHDIFEHTTPEQFIKVIKGKAVLFDSNISGDYMPDILFYTVILITCKDKTLILYVS